ncbi:hypothetical protein GBAR_LOCUS3386, partial [Geodia barretti]
RERKRRRGRSRTSVVSHRLLESLPQRRDNGRQSRQQTMTVRDCLGPWRLSPRGRQPLVLLLGSRSGPQHTERADRERSREGPVARGRDAVQTDVREGEGGYLAAGGDSGERRKHQLTSHQSTRGRGRGVGSGVSSGGDSTKRQRRTAYRSQFTQKRRRKRRKPEDEALWQPAHKSTATENRRPIYVFSTDMANAAADAVLKNRYDSIIQFHNAQPKGPGFLRPSTNDTGRRDDTNNSNDVTRDSSESDDEGEGGGARGGGSGGGGGRGGGVVRGVNEVNKAPKRRSSRLSTSEDTPTAKRLRGGGQARRGSDNSKQTRYSRRLRKRQQASSSPPSSPAESANQSSSEEDESGAESGGSPAPLPVTQRRGG